MTGEPRQASLRRLRAFGIRPNRELGQNFLIDDNILGVIGRAAELMLVETDSPYLSPQPLRGKPNEPANVVHTAHHVAGLRGVAYQELERTVEENAARVFGW